MRKTSSSVKSATRSSQFSPARQRLLFALLTFSSLTSGGAALAGGALPTGGHFVGGAGAITTKGNGLTVNQSTQTGVINWQSFSIGKGNSVNINNGAGTTINRVTGNDVSTIAGSLKSTGSVFVVNTNGIVVTPTGKVITAGSFIASTRDASDASFAGGGAVDLRGTSSGTVVNQGSITSANGDVVLVGKSVTNSGSISAAKGTAALAAGDDVLLQAGGDDTVLVKAGSGDVTNTGTVAAAQAELNAAGGNVYALAVNNGGIIRATGTATRDGHVYLTAGDDLTVNSSVTASNADGTGGTIVATGKTINVKAKANISADGKTDGGTVLIGGDRHGGTDRSVALSKTAIADADVTMVAAGAKISANAGENGDGGNVVIWSNKGTGYAGKISAKGGTKTGKGGFVEVSGEQQMSFTGKVDTRAPHGAEGTLLLDPSDVTIIDTTSNDSSDGGSPTTTFNPTSGATTSTIANTAIQSALNTNNVVVTTTSSGTANGDITVSAPIAWTGNHSLTLQADGRITFNDSSDTISTTGTGAITLSAGGNGVSNDGGTAMVVNANISAAGGTITLVAPNAGYQVVIANTIAVSNTQDHGAGTIILQADQVRLGSGVFPNAIVSTPGEVDIKPTSAGSVFVGDNDSTNSGAFFSATNTALITSEDVINVAANLLVIGSTTTTDMTISNEPGEGRAPNFTGFPAFDALQAHNLKFLTGSNGSVTQDVNTPIIVDDPNQTLNFGIGGLAVSTGKAINLDSPFNSVGTIAFEQTGTGGNINFTRQADSATTGAVANATGLVIGTVGGVAGITAVGSASVVTITANETTANPAAAEAGGFVQPVTLGPLAITQSAGAAGAITAAHLDLEGAASSFTFDSTSNSVGRVSGTVSSLYLYDHTALTQTSGTTLTGTGTGTGTADAAIQIVDHSDITLNTGSTIADANGGDIQLETNTKFSSSATDANTLNPTGGGVWRVYSQSPLTVGEQKGALIDNYIQYHALNSDSAPFSDATDAPMGTGNGFLYTYQPTVTGTVTATRAYDGTTTAAAGILMFGSPTGVVAGDTVTLTLGTGNGTFNSKDVATATTVSVSGTTINTETALNPNNATIQVYNYLVNPNASGTGTITPIPLDITANDASKTYGQTKTFAGTEFTIGTGQLISGEMITSVTLNSAGAAATADKGNYSIVASGGTGNAAFLASNYDITFHNGTLTVNPLNVTVSGTRAYDGTMTAAGSDLGVVGAVNGDTLTVTGSGTVASANANATAQTLNSLGDLTINGTKAGNYNLVSGTLKITPKNVTISGTRAYDGTMTAAGSDETTVSGTLNGDTFTVSGSGTVASANANATAQTLNSLGTLALVGTGNGNYQIASGTLKITPKNVTISGTRAYDGTTVASGSDETTVSGTLNGDTFTVSGSGTVASANANATAQTLNSLGTLALVGTGNGNYQIASGTLKITPKNVTISGTRAYDGTMTASGSDETTVSGTLNGDTFTVSGSGTVASANANATAQTLNSLGTLALVGTGNGNYQIASGTLKITPKNVTISGTRAYDGTMTAAGSDETTVSGTLNGDTFTVSGSGTVASANANATAQTLNSLGTLALVGTGNGNYQIASGTLKITPKNVTISGTRAYDGTMTAAGSDETTVSGTLNGDTFTVSGSGTVASANANATAQTLNSLGTLALVGTGNGNYQIASGTLKITPKNVTISGTRAYDGTTVASGSDETTVSGTLNGDTFTVSGSGTVASANANATAQTLNSLGTLALVGTGNGNYQIASGTLKITPKNVTISGTRAYDGTTVASGSDETTVSGTLNGDTFTVSGSGTVADANVGTNKTLTSLGTLALVGTGSSNYHIASGTLTITPADVTIVGLSGTRVYDGLTDANSSILTLSHIVSGDVVTLSGTGVLANKNVGKETITGIGTLALGGADASNYQIVVDRPDTFVTVTKANLTISAVTQTKVFDGTVTSTGTPTVVGLKTGDSVIGTLIQAYGLKDVLGTDKSTLSVTNYTGLNDGNGGGNYNVTVKTAKGTITPENIVISAVSQTKVYDGTTTSTETPLLSDGTLYNGDTLTGLAQAYGSKNVLGTNGSTLVVDPGYTLTHAGNYDVTVKTAKGTITPLAISATGTRVYDGMPDVDGDILKILNGIPGDDIGLTGTGTSGSKHVGTHDVTDPGTLALTGGDAGNYTLVGGKETVKITPYAVVLLGTRVYDGATDGDSGILAVTNAFAGDTVTVDTGTSTIVSRNVGNEKITDFGTLTLGGASSGDYTLVGAKGIVKVTPELLTVTAVPGTKTYDGTETSDGKPIVTIGTVFGPDTGNFIQTYGSQHAGHNITLTPSGTVDDGNGGKNYIVTYVPVTTGVIDPRPVVLDGTRPIDNTTDAGSPILTITNLVPGDSVSVTGNGVLQGPQVGPQPIIGFGGLTLGGPSDGDYTLTGASGVVTITPVANLTPPPPVVIPNTQTASGVAPAATAYDGGLITFQPRQNGIVTGTIATIDGTDYQPDSQLGCTLGDAGCIQNGVAPGTTSAPQQ